MSQNSKTSIPHHILYYLGQELRKLHQNFPQKKKFLSKYILFPMISNLVLLIPTYNTHFGLKPQDMIYYRKGEKLPSRAMVVKELR